MNSFLRRIKQLEEQLSKKIPSIILVYDDGSERPVGVLEAVDKIRSNPNISDIRCGDETGQSLLTVILEAEREYGDNYDDLGEVCDD